ncbi:sugar transferase [Pseudoruegeria sp. HB172150]|uniref:sugar transferase n=1 Tax=Pseudoruegeria sp. HB172150 TaxID=2721164 RepID=UPI0020A6A192|nr:sugar transferase [Pseudoruegeria sp. HB172150]
MKDFTNGAASVPSMLSPELRNDVIPARNTKRPAPVFNASPKFVASVQNQESAYRRWGKRAIDLVLLMLILPIALPLLALSAIALSIEGQPILFRQKRLGRGGRAFTMLKFRTMVPDAERRLEEYLQSDPLLRQEWDATQKLKQDPRITPLGHFLRRSSLDELPQLWHVLTGEMSLVGPRPMLPQQIDLYGDPYAYVAMRPGITGLWQVSERNESDFTGRAVADREYERICTLTTDLSLIAMTAGVMLRGTGY